MGSVKLLLLMLLFHLFVCLSAAQPDFVYSCIDTYGNYTSDSTYKANLDKVRSDIASNTQIDYGFYNFSAGKEPDQVRAIALCRGDVTISDCHFCLSNSIYKLTEVCPSQKEAIGWYDNCMLRYSNRSIFGIWESKPGFHMSNPTNASDVDLLSKSAGELLHKLQNQARKGDSQHKFATGEANVTYFMKVYGLVQCTPDLSELDCYNCLEDAINVIPSCCYGHLGARDSKPSCNVRFETYRFYRLDNAPLPSPASAPPPPSSPSSVQQTSALAPSPSGKGSGSAKVFIIGALSAAAFVSVIIFVACFLISGRRKPLRKVDRQVDRGDEVHSIESLQFDFETVRVATENFSETNRLGQGGFGAVYKGLLSNGQEIAVKRLARNSGQGELEFKNEVLLVAGLQHRNLVRLVGFCLENEERLLIYEFVPHSSLNYFLFDRTRRIQLDWAKRYKIIGGIARGLLYLHEDSRLRIIHRDLKPSNILLDAEMNPRIADFGVARLFQVGQTHADTKRIVGTYGYMAPEYALHGFFSTKSDVYSFGVLVLEIVTGEKSFNIGNEETADHLVCKVWKDWHEGRSLDIVDPVVLAAGSESDIMRCIHIGLLCVQDGAADRPTMSEVVLMLNSQSVALPSPSQPTYVMNRNMNVSSNSGDGSSQGTSQTSQSKSKTTMSTGDLETITDLYPR